jgi:hypothetical protein
MPGDSPSPILGSPLVSPGGCGCKDKRPGAAGPRPGLFVRGPKLKFVSETEQTILFAGCKLMGIPATPSATIGDCELGNARV